MSRAIASIAHVLFALCAIIVPAPTRADSPVPIPADAGRYATLLKHSPFAVASAVETVPAPQASFADNCFVSGVGRIGDQDFATVRSRDLSHQFTLFAGESEEGVALVEVNWSDEVGKSTVILKKGTETAKLEFNEAQLRGPASNGTAASANAQPHPAGTRGSAQLGAATTITAALNANAARARRTMPQMPQPPGFPQSPRRR